MTEEKLLQAQKVLGEIQCREILIKSIDELAAKQRHVVLEDFNSKRISVPSDLRGIFLSLLRDFYAKELCTLSKEFEEM